MDRLNDYSGELIPNLTPTDFSADALEKIVQLYSKLYTALDGFWYLTVKDRISNEEALACDIRVWELLGKYEMKSIANWLNIKGNDVIAVLKAFQLSPMFQHMQHNIEIFNNKHAILTVTHCPTLNALEKEGQGREKQICNMVDPRIFKVMASFFNPDIDVKCLKSAPRKNTEEICCQWEFKLADNTPK